MMTSHTGSKRKQCLTSPFALSCVQDVKTARSYSDKLIVSNHEFIRISSIVTFLQTTESIHKTEKKNQQQPLELMWMISKQYQFVRNLNMVVSLYNDHP